MTCCRRTALPLGHGTLVPAHQHLSHSDGARERAGRHLSHHGKGWELWRPRRSCTAARPKTCCAPSACSTRPASRRLSFPRRPEATRARHCARLEPDILLLDEPTAGMSTAETQKSIALIERLARARNLTLLFTEHDMEVVFSIAQRIIVLHQGRCSPTASRRRSGRPASAPGLSGDPVSVAAVLAVEDIYTAYGQSQVLFGVSLEIVQASVSACWAATAWARSTTIRTIIGLTPPQPRPRVVEGQRHHRQAALPGGAARHRLRTGGSPDLRRAHGVGEPGDRRQRVTTGHRRAGHSERVFDLFPELREIAAAGAAICPAASSRC